MHAEGELPELMPPEPGGSFVTAVSALHAKNLPRLLRRMHAAVGAARETRERAAREAHAFARDEAARRAAASDEYEYG